MISSFRNYSPLLLVSCILVLLIAACSLSAPQPPSSTPVGEASPTLIALAPTLSGIPTDTQLPGTVEEQPPSPTPLPSPSPPPTPTPLVFAVIGDYGKAGPPAAAVATLVSSWNPDILLTVGDNNYPDGEARTIDENIGQYYHSYLALYQGIYGPGAETNRFFPVLGNHDYDFTSGIQPYLDYFTLPGNERYYDFTWGPVHFFALNSDSREPDGVGQSSVQAQWFREAIAASSSPWKIVYMHTPPYSSGLQGSTAWMQWPFAAWGADAVLAGHDHVYERLEVDGIPYITNGLGGSPDLYWFPTTLPESLVRYNTTHGALRVTATETTLTFEFITIAGETIDTLTLFAPSIGETNPTPVVEQPVPPASVVTIPDPAGFGWQSVGTGFRSPILLTHAGDGSHRLFVVEQAGVIRVIGQNTPFLDIQSRVGDQGNEQGLLGLAFDPHYAENSFFYVNYTDNNGDTVVARYQVASDDPNRALPDTETILLRIRQPYANHNGGHLAFGPDGYLYIATGDGGAAGDPENYAQNSFTLLGKLLRIDPRTEPYTLPFDNPFLNGDGLGEIWAYGLRNPWRFSFDRQTGDLYIGDVGQGAWEEINFLPAGTSGRINFGWDYLEGTHAYEGNPPSGLILTPPVWEYGHTGRVCSVTGGYVYRGPSLPEWTGVYLYGDFCSGQVWGLLRDASGMWQNNLLFETGLSITSFGEDEAGEVYLVARQGEIYRLVRR